MGGVGRGGVSGGLYILTKCLPMMPPYYIIRTTTYLCGIARPQEIASKYHSLARMSSGKVSGVTGIGRNADIAYAIPECPVTKIRTPYVPSEKDLEAVPNPGCLPLLFSILFSLPLPQSPISPSLQ